MKNPFVVSFTAATGAVADAAKMARILGEPHVVTVRVVANRAVFDTLMLSSFDSLREKGSVPDIAIYAIITLRDNHVAGEPNVEIAEPFQLPEGTTDV